MFFRLIHEHIKKLSLEITPSHKDLRIPRMYQFECPWTAAQKEIYMINAYKVSSSRIFWMLISFVGNPTQTVLPEMNPTLLKMHILDVDITFSLYTEPPFVHFFLQTPKDKVKCVFRCATTIMNLLSMANERAVPAADDFIPVLIFVLIKANPPCLLSTIQYVQSFYGNRIGGEEQYWWIQFCSAVEFIKNMEYTNEWPQFISVAFSTWVSSDGCRFFFFNIVIWILLVIHKSVLRVIFNPCLKNDDFVIHVCFISHSVLFCYFSCMYLPFSLKYSSFNCYISVKHVTNEEYVIGVFHVVENVSEWLC